MPGCPCGACTGMPFSSELVGSVVVTRHGARTPAAPIGHTTVPAIAQAFEGLTPGHQASAPGQLTLRGKAQLVATGRWLRARYVEGAVTCPQTFLHSHADNAGEGNEDVPPDAAYGTSPDGMDGISEEAEGGNNTAHLVDHPAAISTLPAALPLLKDAYSARRVWVRTSLSPRTRESALALLSGMFPETPEGSFVAVANDYDESMLFPHNLLCPQLNAEYWAAQTSDNYVDTLLDVLPLKAKILKAMGYTPRKPEIQTTAPSDQAKIPGWISIYDIFKSYQFHGLSVPLDLDLTPQEVDTIKHMAFFTMNQQLARDRTLKLAMGRLVSDILGKVEIKAGSYDASFEEAANNPEASPVYPPGYSFLKARSAQYGKLFIYSGHDTTLIPLMHILKLDEHLKVWPTFASFLAIELHINTSPSSSFPDPMYVHILFNGHSARIIPLSQFLEELAPFRVPSIEALGQAGAEAAEELAQERPDASSSLQTGSFTWHRDLSPSAIPYLVSRSEARSDQSL